MYLFAQYNMSTSSRDFSSQKRVPTGCLLS